MDYNRIKIELEHKGISVRELCYKIDVTEQGLHQMIRKKSMKIEILERISNVLSLPMSYWFENEENAKYVASDGMDRNKPNSGKKKNYKLSDEKIDALTKNLNEMLKVMANK